ncbi:GerMN domain-containing protein [Cetobacterium sp.]|uniref:GerMN domain-containing protein n=1 Tax=Cetobacterium sp. TaxID=2071632 RepID=UPI003F374F75
MSNKLKLFLVALISVATITGIYSKQLDKNSKTITQISVPKIQEIKKLEFSTPIFFPDLKAGKLNTENIVLTSNLKEKEEILKEIINNLLIKLENTKIIKKENYKYELFIKNRILYLDLDSKILLSATTPQEELLLIYSFVNSLLTPGGSDTVVLLVNGIPTNKVNFIDINKSYKLNSNI